MNQGNAALDGKTSGNETTAEFEKSEMKDEAVKSEGYEKFSQLESVKEE